MTVGCLFGGFIMKGVDSLNDEIPDGKETGMSAGEIDNS